MFDTDASQYTLGAVLLQEQEVEGDVAEQKEKRWDSVVYWSKPLV